MQMDTGRDRNESDHFDPGKLSLHQWLGAETRTMLPEARPAPSPLAPGTVLRANPRRRERLLSECSPIPGLLDLRACSNGQRRMPQEIERLAQSATDPEHAAAPRPATDQKRSELGIEVPMDEDGRPPAIVAREEPPEEDAQPAHVVRENLQTRDAPCVPEGDEVRVGVGAAVEGDEGGSDVAPPHSSVQLYEAGATEGVGVDAGGHGGATSAQEEGRERGAL